VSRVGELVRRWAARRRSVSRREAKLPVIDVTSWEEKIDLGSIDVVKWTPAWMSGAERLMLYTLAYTLRPLRYLEIGTLEGGSALVVATAMDVLGTSGRLVCVDPEPKVWPDVWKRIEHRTTLVKGASPEILPKARDIAEGPFDLALIDADHTYTGVLRDAEGALPVMADGGLLVFHDSLNRDVGRAIDRFVGNHEEEVVDFGTLTREITVTAGPAGEPQRWGGLRVVRCHPAG
jgi:predicted O-methyltransferase YrrM